jgi:aminopeptidase N
MEASTLAVPSLTREEAADRARILTVDRYGIVLDLTNGKGAPAERDSFRSITTVKFGAQPDSSTFIDIIADKINSATLNDQKIDIKDATKSGRIELSGLKDHNHLVVDADCRYSNTGEGLHCFKDDEDNEIYLYTQFEPAEARRVFACFDQPDLKAEFDVTVTAPPQWEVISNSTAEVQDAGNAKVHTFATTPRMSTYLAALIAGPYASWSTTFSDHDTQLPDIPLRIFCRQSLREHMKPDVDELFSLTTEGFRYYHNTFQQPYAFGKYDQLFVPQFNAGAMENAGAVTFREELIFRGRVTVTARAKRAETLLHELAHMWFGDLVTMKWWDDLWLNEAFATFASVQCMADGTTDFQNAWTTFANADKALAFRQDQLPTTHPVAADVPNLDTAGANFDRITYQKGASILKQLMTYVGKDGFFNGLRKYFETHKFKNATITDLLTELEDASGRELSSWAQQWLRTTGINTLRADFDVDAEGKFTRFAITQSGAKPWRGETRVHQVRVGIYGDDEAGKLTQQHVAKDVTVDGLRTEVPALHGISRGKLILLNDEDQTYCALHLDPDSLQTLRVRIAEITDPLTRSIAWSTAWEMTRQAELRARDFVALVSDGLHAESEVAVTESLLAQAQAALRSYAEPQWTREHGWPQFCDRLLDLARDAKSGSDHQLAYVNAVCTSALSPRHTDVLFKLLDASAADRELPGLQVDPELRWRIIIALAAAGAIDADGPDTPSIDAELERDNTYAGSRNADQARAARPQTSVKETYWQWVFQDDLLPNHRARAIVAGIVSPGQDDLLLPYTSRYFDTLLRPWKRSGEVLKTVVMGLYPSWDISQAAVSTADTFLGRIGDDRGPLRRWVLEAQADVTRALAARALDAQASAINDR